MEFPEGQMFEMQPIRNHSSGKRHLKLQPIAVSFISNRLESAKYEAAQKRRARIRELRRDPDSPGPSPEEIEIEHLRTAIGNAVFALSFVRR